MFAPNSATNILLFKDLMREKQDKLASTIDPAERLKLEAIIEKYQEVIDSLENGVLEWRKI